MHLRYFSERGLNGMEGKHTMSHQPGNLANTRASYDRVAEEYAARIAGELAGKPLDRALLVCLVEQVVGLGDIADIGCGPGQSSLTRVSKIYASARARSRPGQFLNGYAGG